MRRLIALAAVLGLSSASATAAPITYTSFVGPDQTVAGVNNQAPGNSDNPLGAVFHSFYATAGSQITVFGDRQAGHYDMSYWLFSGLFADTNDFGADFDTGDPGFIDFGDDDDAPNIPGPFGDPRSIFFAPVTGYYTVAVTNFLSGAGGPPNPYTLTVQGNAAEPAVPEPATLAVFGALAAGAFGLRRARKSA